MEEIMLNIYPLNLKVNFYVTAKFNNLLVLFMALQFRNNSVHNRWPRLEIELIGKTRRTYLTILQIISVWSTQFWKGTKYFKNWSFEVVFQWWKLEVILEREGSKTSPCHLLPLLGSLGEEKSCIILGTAFSKSSKTFKDI